MFNDVISMLVTEALMLVSGIVGWFMHSAFVTNAVSMVKAEVAKVTASVAPH